MARYAIEYVKVGFRRDNTPLNMVLLRFLGSSDKSILIIPINLSFTLPRLWNFIRKMRLKDTKYNLLFIVPNPDQIPYQIDIEDYYTSGDEIWIKLTSKLPKNSILLTIASSGNGILYFKYLEIRGTLKDVIKRINAPVVSDRELLEKNPYKQLKYTVEDALVIKVPISYTDLTSIMEYTLQMLGAIESESIEMNFSKIGLKNFDKVCRVYSEKAGFIIYHINPGGKVSKGDVIAHVKWFFGETIGSIKAPSDGLIVSLKSQKTIIPGELLAEIIISS